MNVLYLKLVLNNFTKSPQNMKSSHHLRSFHSIQHYLNCHLTTAIQNDGGEYLQIELPAVGISLICFVAAVELTNLQKILHQETIFSGISSFLRDWTLHFMTQLWICSCGIITSSDFKAHLIQKEYTSQVIAITLVSAIDLPQGFRRRWIFISTLPCRLK